MNENQFKAGDGRAAEIWRSEDDCGSRYWRW